MQFSWWYLFVSIPVIWSLWIGFRVFRGINKPSDFFWYPEGMSSEKLRDSLTASNISVGSAIFAFLSFGYSYKLAAFISPLTWLLGFFILYKVFPRIENSEKRTLHGFLANRYDSRFIGYFASLLSIIGFLGTYGIEILVGIKIANVLFPNVSSIYIILGLSLVVCTDTALGGFKAVIDTEKMQLWFSYVGIAAVFGFLISHNENVLSLETLASDHWGFSNLSVLFVLSLIVVNVPWQLIDMSVWQRVCSMRDQKDIKKGLSQSIYSIGISWCVLISLGVLLNYFPDFTAPSNNDPLRPILVSLGSRCSGLPPFFRRPQSITSPPGASWASDQTRSRAAQSRSVIRPFPRKRLPEIQPQSSHGRKSRVFCQA